MAVTAQSGGAPANPPGSYVQVFNCSGYGSTNTVIRVFTTIISNVGTDITYATSAEAGGSFTINANGIYAISYNDAPSVNGVLMGMSLNSDELTTSIGSLTAGHGSVLAIINPRLSDQQFYCGWTGKLVATDVVRAHWSGEGGAPPSAGRTSFTITQVYKL